MMAQTRKVKRGQTVLYKGEVPSSIFTVTSGLVRASNILDNGDERTVALFGPSEFFPVGVAFGHTNVALFYYETLTDTELEVHPKSEFAQKLVTQNSIEDTKRFASQYVAMMLHVSALGHHLAKNKVIHIVHFLCLRYGEPTINKSIIRIPIPLTQHDIARMSGLTRETVTIEIGKLKSRNILEVKQKQYLVHQKRLLEALDDTEISSVKL